MKSEGADGRDGLNRSTVTAPADWRQHLLADIADVTVGHVGPMAHEYVAEGVPFLRSKDIQPLRIDSDDLKYISPEFHGRLAKSALAPGDVVIVRTGQPGTAAVIPAHLPTSNCADLVIVRPRSHLDSRFLAYYVNSAARDHINAHIVGAVQQHFNVSSANALPIPLPSMDEQVRIVGVLSAFDDKIDSNRRLAGLLEEASATTFKARFVDFVGLEEFEASDVGRIPRGWRVVPVGEVLSVVGGSTPSTKVPAYWDGDHCWATPKDLSGLTSPVLLDTGHRITALGVDQISSKVLPERTVLLSSRAPVGYTAISFVPVSVNQGFIAIPPNERVPSEFVLFWLRANMDTIKANASGTTFAEISKKNFRPIPMVLPPAVALEAFASVAGPTFDVVAGLARESACLAEIRDALLPKLISGQIRVPDTADPEEVIGSAAEELAGATG